MINKCINCLHREAGITRGLTQFNEFKTIGPMFVLSLYDTETPTWQLKCAKFFLNSSVPFLCHLTPPFGFIFQTDSL